uniref:Uncharacterized protein n=1 Tax=Anguilla anguilla TaxID=7936 RepID=A0A0E9UVK2_ANGAN
MLMATGIQCQFVFVFICILTTC